jgi:hypothetical protein
MEVFSKYKYAQWARTNVSEEDALLALLDEGHWTSGLDGAPVSKSKPRYIMLKVDTSSNFLRPGARLIMNDDWIEER